MPRPPARTGHSSARSVPLGRRRLRRPTSVRLRPVKGRPFPVLLGLLLVVLVTVLAVGQLGIIGGASSKGSSPQTAPRASAPPTASSPTPAASDGDTAVPPPSSPASATSAPISDVLVVPVTNFRAPQTATTHAELEHVLAGT